MQEQQKKYARRGRDKQDFQKDINKKTLEYAKQLAEEDSRYKGLKIKPMSVAYIPSPKEKTEAVMRLVDGILVDHACKKTQKALVAEVRKQFPELELHDSIFSQKREKWFIDKVQKRINGYAKEPFSVEGCRSLSDVRKRLKAKFLEQDGKKKPVTLKVEIIFTGEAVIVNGEPFACYKKVSNNKKYQCIKFMRQGRQHSIRVRALADLLDR